MKTDMDCASQEVESNMMFIRHELVLATSQATELTMVSISTAKERTTL